MIEIDGSLGEGGGQVLRSSLALSLVTLEPVRITNVRAGRSRPGLLHQHLAAVRAAQAVGRADVRGAALGSREIVFVPHAVEPGRHRFRVGTAGSATLVLQTVLPPLLLAGGTSHLDLEGGTHNPWAPPWDFLARAFLPLLARLGPRIETRLARHGFYPRGGGRFDVRIEPRPLQPFELCERGELRRVIATATVARLPASIAEREVEVLARGLGLGREDCRIAVLEDAPGPGNVLTVDIVAEHATEVVTVFGRKGLPAEAVAEAALEEARQLLEGEVPVGAHLADQLMIPFALARGGAYRTLPLSPHAETNALVVERFLGLRIEVEPAGESRIVRIRA